MPGALSSTVFLDRMLVRLFGRYEIGRQAMKCLSSPRQGNEWHVQGTPEEPVLKNLPAAEEIESSRNVCTEAWCTSL